jgi:hypothetical protein
VPDLVADLWKVAPVAVVLALVLWAGARGWWYWGAATRAMLAAVERDRDEWRALAIALLREKGIAFQVAPRRADEVVLPPLRRDNGRE